jgi:hypothetical protein
MVALLLLLLPVQPALAPLVSTTEATAGRPLLLARPSSYGGWAERDGLPAFVYTADQTAVPTAALPPNAEYGHGANVSSCALRQGACDRTTRGDREHSVALGNDRIVLVGSNYGSWRIRADEGGPKWLTDSDVDDESGWKFGGGLSYVFDAATKQQLATSAFTPGEPSPREWGTGYGITRSPPVTAGVSVEHTVGVLPGEQPVALIEVVLANHDAAEKTLTLAEVWDTGMVHQLTGHGWAGWSNWTHTALPELNATAAVMLDKRSFVAKHYKSSFERFANGSGVGVIIRRNYTGLTASEREFFTRTSMLPQLPDPETGKASLWDREPPAVFLAAVPGDDGDATPTESNTTFANSGRRFFGTGGRLSPEAGVSWSEEVPEGETALIALSTMVVPAHGTTKRRYVVGYVPSGACLNGKDGTILLNCAPKLLAKAADATGEAEAPTPAPAPAPPATYKSLAAEARAKWKPLLVEAKVESQPWVQRELLWHSYQLQATPTFDTYFNETIIDQVCVLYARCAYLRDSWQP